MITVLNDAAIYTLEADEDVPYAELSEFYIAGDHDDDVCKIEFSDGRVWYANKGDVEKRTAGADCYVRLADDFFKCAYLNRHVAGGSLPVLDEDGEPVYLLKCLGTPYIHSYLCNPADVDVSVLEIYDVVVLHELNEFSYLILAECVPMYRGDVVLVGGSWEDLLRRYPAGRLGNRMDQVKYARTEMELEAALSGRPVMHIMPVLGKMYDMRRTDLCYYDAVMTLLYYFADSHGRQPRKQTAKNGKRFVVIDVSYGKSEGFVSIYGKLWDMYRYAEARGYIPILSVKSSPESIYSDVDGEDVWEKFFVQPSGYSLDDIDWEVDDVRYSPNVSFMLNCIALMQKITPPKPLYMSAFLNRRCLDFIETARKEVFGERKNILGLLVRGTDYVSSRPGGHPVQATVEQVIAKAAELGSDKFSYIYVATEDEDILNRLKTEYGERLLCTGQQRYRTQPGQRLGEVDTGRGHDGWLRGVEYLASLHLLAECDGIVASGLNGGILYVERMGAKKYNPHYIFNLGRY